MEMLRSFFRWIGKIVQAIASLFGLSSINRTQYVLIAGGNTAYNAEIFSDGLITVGGGRFSQVGAMQHHRIMHTATLLDDGRILITGGNNVNAGNLAETYNPKTNTFSNIQNPMQIPRYGHSATKLGNGKVLIVGAENGSINAELFDPSGNAFTQTADTLILARQFHTATLLNDGKVLIFGGYEQPISLPYSGVREEFYDPSSDNFFTYNFSSNNLNNHLLRKFHTATRLHDGRVLITGGTGVNNGDASVSSAVVFNPATQTFQNLSSQMNVARSEHTATLLNDEYVLIVGGIGVNGLPLDSAELFNPFLDIFIPTLIPMTRKHMRHTAVLLRNGTVMIAGGENDSDIIKVVEICTPEKRIDPIAQANPSNYIFTASDNLVLSRSLHTATPYMG